MCGAGGASEEPGSPPVWSLDEEVKNYSSIEKVPKWDGRNF